MRFKQIDVRLAIIRNTFQVFFAIDRARRTARSEPSTRSFAELRKDFAPSWGQPSDVRRIPEPSQGERHAWRTFQNAARDISLAGFGSLPGLRVCVEPARWIPTVRRIERMSQLASRDKSVRSQSPIALVVRRKRASSSDNAECFVGPHLPISKPPAFRNVEYVVAFRPAEFRPPTICLPIRADVCLSESDRHSDNGVGPICLPPAHRSVALRAGEWHAELCQAKSFHRIENCGTAEKPINSNPPSRLLTYFET